MPQHKPAKSRNTCDPEIPNDLNFSLERWMISTVAWIKSVPDFQGSPEPASQVSFSQQSSLAKPAECHGATGFGAMMCHGT